MALIQLTSDLTWTGPVAQNTTTPYAQPNLSNNTSPPAVNYLDNLNPPTIDRLTDTAPASVVEEKKT